MDEDLLGMCLGGDFPWRVKQVSTHGHDRFIDANPLIPHWKEFKDRVKHRDNVRIAPNSKFEFPLIEGPGMIVNIWITFTPYKLYRVAGYHKHWESRKKLRIQIFFDENEDNPSVDAPVGDFFGVGFGEYKEFTSKYLEETSGGYICRFPMPFKKKARVVMVNTSKKHSILAFYGAITYRQYYNDFPEEPYYFHAYYREEYPTRKAIPFKILDAKGKGFYVGMVMSIENAKRGYGLSFLEGNTKIFVDDDTDTPSLEYTGTEDIFQGAWYYISGEFHAPYSGLTVRSFARKGPVRTFFYTTWAKNKTSQYRFHEHDAIPFRKSILIHLHHGEFDEVPTNQSCVVYLYARKNIEVNLAPLQAGEFVDEYHA